MRRKVQVWLYKKDAKEKYLFLILQTNAQRKSFWQPVTGSAEEGEALAAAAIREATEETALRVVGAPELLGLPFQFTSFGEPVEEQAFSAEVVPGPVKLDPMEHVDFKWVSAHDAERLVQFDSNRERLKLLVEKLDFQSSVR